MITIDGSQGEGGGQIVRSALALALVTGRPFTIENIRAGRAKPGLMRQHLTAVRAAAQIGGAQTRGAELRSTTLTFEPGTVRPGNYHFSVGTAGSATLVLQTVLPALLCADGPGTLRLEGGTHNPWAPPFDFLAQAFLPLINRMGPQVIATLVRPGFYPAGGGEFEITITPAKTLTPIELLTRGELRQTRAIAQVAHLPRTIAARELRVIQRRLGLGDAACVIDEVSGSLGPGNIVTIEVAAEHVTEIFTGFGEKQVTAEAVADKAVRAARRYISNDVAVGEYLTDQLLLPLALARGGAFQTLGLSRHAETNIAVIKAFLDVDFEIEPQPPRGCVVRVTV
jgi:RNA 3'-terminal phosphate cyclase (ATP)